MSDENKKLSEEIKEAIEAGPVEGPLKMNDVLSKGPIADAGKKIIEASDKLAENAPIEQLEKIGEKVETIASRAGAENLDTLGDIVENATGSGAVTADTSDANPGEPPEIPEDVAAGIRTAGGIITGTDTYVNPE